MGRTGISTTTGAHAAAANPFARAVGSSHRAEPRTRAPQGFSPAEIPQSVAGSCGSKQCPDKAPPTGYSERQAAQLCARATSAPVRAHARVSPSSSYYPQYALRSRES